MDENDLTPRTATVLNDIPVDISVDQVTARINMSAGAEKVHLIAEELLDLAKQTAVPKAVYRVSIARNEGKLVYVDDVPMKSYVPLLRFDTPERVFPYIATCGTEIDEAGIPKIEFLRYYVLNIIKELLLFSAAHYLKNHLITTFGLQELTHIGPGEAFGPIRQQKELFSIIGDARKSIGVRLSPHNLIIPEKSTSGMFFETSVEIERCIICPQVTCTARRQPYDPAVLLHYRNG